MTTGFNLVDFMDLPSVERCVLRLVLRESPISYPQLRSAVSEQKLDDHKLNAALDHLMGIQWLVRQIRDQQVFYRLNSAAKSGSQNPTFWDNLELDSIPQSPSLDLQVDPENPALPMQRGGKRRLPKQIWDCLCDVPLDESTKAPESRAGRRGSLFDSLIDD